MGLLMAPPPGYRKTAPTATPPVISRPPLPEDRGDSVRMPYPLGAWTGDKFVFKSPEAEKQWHADSFLQGSHHLLWMKGRRLRPDENTLASMGLPPSDDVYQGPDGQHYQTTPASREDPHMTMLRAAHLAAEPPQGNASAMGQRASLKALPQAMAMMAQGGRVEAKPLAANDNHTAANDNAASQALIAPTKTRTLGASLQSQTTRVEPAEPTKQAISLGPAEPKIRTTAELAAYNRSGHMTAAQRQAASDDVTLLYSGATAGFGDNAIAALKALGDYADGKEFGAGYDTALKAEQRKTEEARNREKIAGALIESLPSFFPGYGDVTGLIADLKMYREHPDERTWKNAGMTALGILPFIPSVASTVRRVGKAVHAAEDSAKMAAKESEAAARLAKATGRNVLDWDSVLLDAQRYPHTEAGIRKMNGEARGVVFIDEWPIDNEVARKFQEEASGAVFHIDTKRQLVPGLAYKNPNERGVHVVKFDSYEISSDGATLFMKDQKTKLVLNKRSIKELQNRFGRIRSALEQNPGIKVLYEFPDEKTKDAAANFIQRCGCSDIISARVRQ
jgi:hypothetical protein